MNISKFSFRASVIFVYILLSVSFAQETDISKPLRNIDEGKSELAAEELSKLKIKSPEDPSVIYLDAVLTPDAKEAVIKYKLIADNHADSKYADAANYQIYSYYYAVGNYTLAKKQLEKLKTNYPNSVYIKKIESKTTDTKTETFANNKTFELKERKESKKQPQVKENSEFTVQTGAFLVKGNAEKLLKLLKEKRIKAEIIEKKVGGSNFFVVNAGKCKSMEEAEDLFEYIKRAIKVEGRIVNLN
jgi:cell division septation protein DedD